MSTKESDSMLRIAICDDDHLHSENLNELLTAYCKQHNIQLKVQIFTSGFDLLATVDDQAHFDLYFLDIVMPHISGIEVGHKIRCNNTDSLIIFLTTSPEYAVESYTIRAFHYLLKPYDPAYLTTVLDQAFSILLPKEDRFILVKTHETIQKLPLDQILYAELYNRAIRYYLKDNTYIDSLSLRESFQAAVSPLLKYSHFIRCGASFVVNLKHIAAIKKNYACFKNNQQLLLPKQAHITLKEAWLNYWLEEDTQ